MSKKNKCFVSTEGRILDQSRWEPLLWAYGKIYGTTMREVYVRLIIKGERAKSANINAMAFVVGETSFRPG